MEHIDIIQICRCCPALNNELSSFCMYSICNLCFDRVLDSKKKPLYSKVLPLFIQISWSLFFLSFFVLVCLFWFCGNGCWCRIYIYSLIYYPTKHNEYKRCKPIWKQISTIGFYVILCQSRYAKFEIYDNYYLSRKENLRFTREKKKIFFDNEKLLTEWIRGSLNYFYDSTNSM